jgi:hypothetical protein
VLKGKNRIVVQVHFYIIVSGKIIKLRHRKLEAICVPSSDLK